jgi:hydrogenase expression/formation protein HypC
MVDYGGVARKAELMLVPGASVGDKVLVHAGFAISILDERAAEEMLSAIRETKLYG